MLYNTIESNNKKIKLNEELIKNKNKRKKEFLNYNKYQAGLQTDLYERLQDINSVKQQLAESESKEIVPFVKEVDDDDDERLYFLQLQEAYKELDIFNPNPISKVSPTSKFIVHTNPQTRKVMIFMNEKKNVQITKFDPINQTFEMNGKTFHFNKNVIKLMRGDFLLNHTEEDLRTYSQILNEGGAAKSSGRYKEVLNRLHQQGLHHQGKVGNGLEPCSATPPTFLPDNPTELFNRLHILIAARNEGHNSSENEIHAILKRLLEKNLITSNQYRKFSQKS